MANMPPKATVALVEMMSAFGRYYERLSAAGLLGLDPEHPANDETAMIIRDAEQALITILTELFGEPDIEAVG